MLLTLREGARGQEEIEVPSPEAERRRTKRCTRQGAELKVPHDRLDFINVRPAGDRRCSTAR